MKKILIKIINWYQKNISLWLESKNVGVNIIQHAQNIQNKQLKNMEP